MREHSFFFGATYGDFLLRPHKGILQSRTDADLSMPLVGDIALKLPIVGANMDTVTGGDMAEALALEGSIGFLHRNLPIGEEENAVKQVKRKRAYVIEKPFILHKKVLLGDAVSRMEKEEVSGILIEEHPDSRILAGILSHRDIPRTDGDYYARPIEEFCTPFDKLTTATRSIDIKDAERLMYENRIEKLPLIDKNKIIQGLITLRDLRLAKKKPYHSVDAKGRLIVGATIGATRDYLERADAVIKEGADCILMDVAHAHSVVVEKAVGEFRKQFGYDVLLICGNIGTLMGAEFLTNLGVNAVKVGIGPGRGCRTRLETGVGVPQLQAIREVFSRTGIPVIADGGVQDDKDIALSILAGASCVMLGSMLAGTAESPGNTIMDSRTGQRVKIYRGMTDPRAVVSYSENIENDLETPSEGQSQEIPYKGSVVPVLNRIRGHLQSMVSYLGSSSIADLWKEATDSPEKYFIRLTDASQKESFDR